MKDLLEKLLVIQDRDSKLLRLTLEQERIPVDQAELDRQIKAATDQLGSAKNEQMRLETDRKKLELIENSKTEQIRKYKSQLLEIKNNEQFHALQHEILAAEGEVRQLEDQELEFMEKLETAQKGIQEAEANLKDVRQKVELQRKDLEQKKGRIQGQWDELNKERAELAGKVDEDILSRYERVFRSKKGMAIVGIEHGMCKGCHLKLTAQEIHKARNGDHLVSCTNCDRILYCLD